MTDNPYSNPAPGPPVHRARLPVAVELLQQILKFPDETRITAGALSPDGRTLELVIEDPRLAPIYDGQEIPQSVPLFVRHYGGGDLIQSIWDFDGEKVIAGDTLPDDDPPTEQELVAHDHVWGIEGPAPIRCEICGYPLTPALADEAGLDWPRRP